jgi:hypothetical protein
MSQTATLSELAAKISVAASTIDNYLKANNVPSTSLKADSPMELPSAPEVAMARMELLDLLNDMKILAQGPAETITFGCLQVRVLSKLLSPLFPVGRVPTPKLKSDNPHESDCLPN